MKKSKEPVFYRPPRLEPLFTEIPRPLKHIEVVGALDGGKLSRSNVGIIHHDIVFGSPRYRLNRTEFDRFLGSLGDWVEVMEKWRKAVSTPPFANQNRLKHQSGVARARFLKKYGAAVHALWAPVRQEGSTRLVPFFNPVFFPRRSKDLPYFWRMVDLVNRLWMVDPISESRGKVPKLTEKEYLEIARLWRGGHSDVKIARQIVDANDSDAVARVRRARVRMGYRRSHRKKQSSPPIGR